MTETRKLNPLITLAAISVTVFSLVGIAAITGLLPSSFSRSDESALNKPASPAARASVPATVSTSAKNTGSGATLPATKSASTSSATRKAAPSTCAGCGVVVNIVAIEQKGDGSGLGAVAGGVVGGVLGNQVGGGTGKKILTVAGVAGGAYAGHQAEKALNAKTRYEVTVNMDDGNTRSFSYDRQPDFPIGSRVKLVNGLPVSA
jgi:outer membrane lipoprotein SlyB